MPSKIRQRIIESAVTCFADYGYHGCSTKTISQHANVTEGSLFRLFSSKEKLFDEALNLVRSRALGQKEFERLLNAGSIETGLQRAFAAMYASLTRDSVRLLGFALLERNESSRELLTEAHDGRLKAVTKRIRLGIKKREVRKDIDPVAAATAIYFAVRTLPFDSFISGHTRKETSALIEKLIGFFFHGILPR